jgi:hypothetical protein
VRDLIESQPKEERPPPRKALVKTEAKPEKPAKKRLVKEEVKRQSLKERLKKASKFFELEAEEGSGESGSDEEGRKVPRGQGKKESFLTDPRARDLH